MIDLPTMDVATTSRDLDAFIAAHYRRLVGLLTLRTGSRIDAEDLAQDVCSKLVTHWPQVVEMDNPWGWLATVAVNSSSSFWRRTIRSRKFSNQLAAAPEEHQMDTEPVEMRSVVALLPQRQRKALILRYYAQLSVRETAEAMGCAEGTVKSLTHQAIARLRIELDQEIDDED